MWVTGSNRTVAEAFVQLLERSIRTFHQPVAQMPDALLNVFFDVLIDALIELNFELGRMTRTEQRRKQTRQLKMFQEKFFQVFGHSKEDVVDFVRLKVKISGRLSTIFVDDSSQNFDHLERRETEKIRSIDVFFTFSSSCKTSSRFFIRWMFSSKIRSTMPNGFSSFSFNFFVSLSSTPRNSRRSAKPTSFRALTGKIRMDFSSSTSWAFF